MCENTASAHAVTPAGQNQTWDGHSEGNQTCYSSCVAFLDFKSDNLKREKRQSQSRHKWGEQKKKKVWFLQDRKKTEILQNK